MIPSLFLFSSLSLSLSIEKRNVTPRYVKIFPPKSWSTCNLDQILPSLRKHETLLSFSANIEFHPLKLYGRSTSYFGKTAIEPEDASLCRSSFKIAWPSNSSLEFSSYRQFRSSILVLYRNWLYFDNNNLLSNWRPLDGSSLRSCIVPRSWRGIKDPLSSKERLAVVSEPEFRASIYASSKGRSEESFRLI